MKRCPRCKCVVDEDTECPVCHTTLTYEPTVDAEREFFPPGRDYLLYLLKKIWFALLCLIVCLLLAVFRRPAIGVLPITSLGCCFIALAVSFFDRELVRGMRGKYTADFAAWKVSVWRYIVSILAVIIMLISR